MTICLKAFSWRVFEQANTRLKNIKCGNGLLFQQGNKPAGIFLTWEQLGMNHGAKAAAAFIPLAAMLLGKGNGVAWAHNVAHAAPFTAQRVYRKVVALLLYGFKTAHYLATATVYAVFLGYARFHPGNEGMLLLHVGCKKNV